MKIRNEWWKVFGNKILLQQLTEAKKSLHLLYKFLCITLRGFSFTWRLGAANLH